MKLYSTKPGQRNKIGRLLIEGTLEELVAFISSVGDGCSIGKIETADLEENGGNWGFPPENWCEESPYYFETKTETVGGFETLKETLIAYVSDDESVTIID